MCVPRKRRSIRIDRNDVDPYCNEAFFVGSECGAAVVKMRHFLSPVVRHSPSNRRKMTYYKIFPSFVIRFKHFRRVLINDIVYRKTISPHCLPPAVNRKCVRPSTGHGVQSLPEHGKCLHISQYLHISSIFHVCIFARRSHSSHHYILVVSVFHVHKHARINAIHIHRDRCLSFRSRKMLLERQKTVKKKQQQLLCRVYFGCMVNTHC